MDELKPVQKKTRIYLVSVFFILTVIFLVGIFWLASTPGQTVGLTLSFAAGLSMIVLPCTFPLVFVIVPLAMGKNPKKGLMMAVLFGLGLIITLSIYGVVVAWAGQIFGLASISKWMFLVAGAAALLFGLEELGLIRLKLPSYGGATPQFITKQGDYLKALFMGLFLGNAGIACPNPATYVILTYIASTGSVVYGAALQALNGQGNWIFPNGACECRIHLEQGHLDKVCPECRKGLAEGRGVFEMAKKTQGPAFALLGGLILGPVAWYFIDRKIKKSKVEAVKPKHNNP